MNIPFYGAVPWVAAAGYLWLSWAYRKSPSEKPDSMAPHLRQIALLLVLALHGAVLLPNWFANENLHFGFATAISWTLWLAVLLLWIEAWFQRLPPIARAIFPIAAVAAVMPVVFVGPVVSGVQQLGFRLHMLLAMLAYSTFTLATICAVMMILMERALHKTKRFSMNEKDFWQGLPSLLSLDQTLVRVVLIGFLLLTLTLLSGVVVSQNLGYGWMRFDHKTVFTVATWLLAAALLAGRRWWGWRGRVAARWTIAGYITLLMAYVGTKFVLEVLLHRVA